jgi:hypothetical protein
MLVGHYAIALLAKSLDRKPSLTSYFIATQFIDFIWLALVVLQLETVTVAPQGGPSVRADILDFVSQPYSHSLVAVLGWSVLFGFLIHRFQIGGRNLYRSVLFGLVVCSHWWLDLLVHHADLPIYGGGPEVGASLWSHVRVAIALESVLLLIGFVLYVMRTTARPDDGENRGWVERHTQWWPWLLLVALVGVHAFASAFWLWVGFLPTAIVQWVQAHALVVIVSMLGATWVALPLFTYLCVDRVRVARP